MRWKTLVIFVLAVAIAFAAAAYRFTDSSHAIGMLSVKGGKARHPFLVESGHGLYTLVMTGTVLPPFKGEVRIALEGTPVMNYAIYNTAPLVNLGVHRRPKLDGNTLRGVESGDRLALWVVMQPQSGEAGAPAQQALTLSFYAEEGDQKLLQVPVVFTDLQQGGAHGS